MDPNRAFGPLHIQWDIFRNQYSDFFSFFSELWRRIVKLLITRKSIFHLSLIFVFFTTFTNAFIMWFIWLIRRFYLQCVFSICSFGYGMAIKVDCGQSSESLPLLYQILKFIGFCTVRLLILDSSQQEKKVDDIKTVNQIYCWIVSLLWHYHPMANN